MYDTQRPFAATYALVKNEEGKIAFVLRSNTPWMNGFYSLPAGKTERDEKYSTGAIREAKEEIGIDIEREDLKHAITVHRFSVEEDGSTLTWADVCFEIDRWSGKPYNAEPSRHSQIVWFDPKKLPENVIPPQAAMVAAWLKGEKYLEYGWPESKE